MYKIHAGTYGCYKNESIGSNDSQNMYRHQWVTDEWIRCYMRVAFEPMLTNSTVIPAYSSQTE